MEIAFIHSFVPSSSSSFGCFSITSSLSLEFKQFRICTLVLTIFVSINRPFTIISFSVLKIVCSSWLYWILFSLLLFDILPWEDEYCYCEIDRQFIEYIRFENMKTLFGCQEKLYRFVLGLTTIVIIIIIIFLFAWV